MNNRVLEEYMRTFAKKNELNYKRSNEYKLFEAFATYYIVSKIMDGDFNYSNIDNMLIGGSADTGIDAIGIIIRGEFIDTIEELDDLIKAPLNSRPSVTLIFIQAKTSPNFKCADMRTFGAGIVDILQEKPKLNQNEEIKEKWNMINKIIENAERFSEIYGRAYYITTGKFSKTDKNIKATISNIKKDVENENIFKDFAFLSIDNEMLRNYYNESKTKVKTTIYFHNRVTLPNIEGIKQGWYGYISEEEFLKLIEDENDDLRRSLFFDNVRDFIGYDTPANKAIADTLQSDTPQNMAILNNGITIIAEVTSIVRDDLTLKNFQIVNGCQTSYVIYQNRKLAKKDVYIPVKILETKNKNVANQITVANNRQNAVDDKELLALTDVQRELEEYFKVAHKNKERLYYERRANQYHDSNVEKVRIVSVSMSLKCYSSMFLSIPHIASRWIGKLYKDYSTKVFDKNNPEEAFYTSSLALYRYLFFNRGLSFGNNCGKFKFFVLLMLRLYLTGDSTSMEFATKKDIEKECKVINKVLWNKVECQTLMKKMVDIIKIVAKEENINITDTGLTANKNFLKKVLMKVEQLRKEERDC